MSSFALVQAGKVVQIDAVVFAVNPALTWTNDISAVTPAPQIGWSAVETAGAWVFTAPAAAPGPTIEAQAQAALDASDITIIRCMSAQPPVAAPAAWTSYRAELRSIRNGTASPMPTTLPTSPAFPAGT